MNDLSNRNLSSTLGFAAAIALGLAAPAFAATDASKTTTTTTTTTPQTTTTAAAAPVAKASAAKPTVDELVLVETIRMTPVSSAERIIGSTVHTADNKKVGTVKDILIGENDKIVAVTVGVGGFLGIDETYLAFPLKDIRFNTDGGSLKVTTDLDKAAIERAAKRR